MREEMKKQQSENQYQENNARNINPNSMYEPSSNVNLN